MRALNRWMPLLILLSLIIFLLPGCSSVNTKHPMVVSAEVKPGSPEEFSYVYFIRPKPYKPKGVADESIRVEFLEEVLLTIDEGSYTLLRIKPSKGLLKVSNETKFINDTRPVKVWRTREYKFIAGKTYFIYLKRINEEFRGIFYDPQPVDLKKAKALSQKPRASGEARNIPIEDLKNISEPPSSAVSGLNPALPENIYKKERYLK
ncbi:MAG: hypothetical protein V3R49_06380 [Gammaproteobacteria bacterium]